MGLLAPVQILPTQEYYSSHYALLDTLSEAAYYQMKTLGEKLTFPSPSAHNPVTDPSPPDTWPEMEGDLVKQLHLMLREELSLSAEQLEERQEVWAQLHLQGERGEWQQFFSLTSLSPASLSTSRLSLKLSSESFASYRGREPILLPLYFQEEGIEEGEEGELHYSVAQWSGAREEFIPIYVAGFYDSGMLPMAPLLAPYAVTTPILLSQQEIEPRGEANFFALHLANLREVEGMARRIEELLKERGLSDYWQVRSYRDSPMTRGLLSHVQSQRALFTLLSWVILLVASVNIISLLILLVHHKRKQIAILRSMGASAFTILATFFLCANGIGFLSFFLGTFIAFYTLHYLPQILEAIQELQGFPLISPSLYGGQLPHQMDMQVVGLALIATALFSSLASLLPAYRAASLSPSAILRKSS